MPLVNDLSNTYTISECSGKFYVKGYRNVGVGKYEKPYLHRLLMGEPTDLVIDHIDGNTLNNCRANLRAVTQSQNLQNRKGAMSNSKSGVRGVFRRKDCNRWEAQVVVRRKKYRSLHITKEEAEQAAIKLRKSILPYSDDDRGKDVC